MSEQQAKRHGQVVVIDDDPIFRDDMAQLLAEMKFNAVCFESGSAAFRYMQAQPWSWFPSLILTDIVMDGMGGYQVIQKVNELYPKRHIPIVVVTQLNAADYRFEAEAAGASFFLVKPIDKEKLTTAIRRSSAR